MTEELSEMSLDEFVDKVVSISANVVLQACCSMKFFVCPVVLPLYESIYHFIPAAVNRRIWAYLRGWTC